MMTFVIRMTSMPWHAWVAPLGSSTVYVTSRAAARRFQTEQEAERSLCHGERIETISRDELAVASGPTTAEQHDARPRTP